jgi:di/tricarboxylate transporter
MLALAAAIVMLAIGWALPPPLGLSAVAWHTLVVLLAALPALALDAMLEGVLALMLAGAWVAFGIVDPAVALAGFATSNWVLVVAVLIIGAAITATGLLPARAGGHHAYAGRISGRGDRAVARRAADRSGGAERYNRVIMIAPMLKELVEALGYRGAPSPRRDCHGGPDRVRPNGDVSHELATAILVLAVLPAKRKRFELGHLGALWRARQHHPSCRLVASILWLYRPAARRPAARERTGSIARAATALLGPMSRDEKVALGVGIGLLLGFMTQPLHHVDPAWSRFWQPACSRHARGHGRTLRAVNWTLRCCSASSSASPRYSGVRASIAGWPSGRRRGRGSVGGAVVFVVVVACFALRSASWCGGRPRPRSSPSRSRSSRARPACILSSSA